MRRSEPATAPAHAFVDSGGWIALFSARDQHHAEADRLFRAAAARQTRLSTTVLVLAEVHRLLLFRAGPPAAAAALARIDASSLVGLELVTRDDHRSARRWLERLADQRITYADAVSFAVMEARGLRTALAFDHHFELAGFLRWRTQAASPR